MGTTSKVLHVFFRVFEFICALIVTSILSYFFARVNDGNGSSNSRLVYTIVISTISIVVSLGLLPPARYAFLAFPLDFIFFIFWIVAFSLLENLTINGGCGSHWFWSYWGFYWGGYWWVPGPYDTPVLVGNSGCSSWRSVLAFSFIGCMCWLANALIGFAVVIIAHTDKQFDNEGQTPVMKEHQAAQAAQDPHGPMGGGYYAPANNGVPPAAAGNPPPPNPSGGNYPPADYNNNAQYQRDVPPAQPQQQPVPTQESGTVPTTGDEKASPSNYA